MSFFINIFYQLFYYYILGKKAQGSFKKIIKLSGNENYVAKYMIKNIAFKICLLTIYARYIAVVPFLYTYL